MVSSCGAHSSWFKFDCATVELFMSADVLELECFN